MLLTMPRISPNQQATGAQWSNLSSCSSQHHHVGKGNTRQVQSVSWGTLQHPNATTSEQCGKSEMLKDVLDLRMAQEKLLKDQEHDTEVIQKNLERAYQHDLNRIKEQKIQEEQYDLPSLHEQEEYQGEEQHNPKVVQEREYCEQKHGFNTVQEQQQVQEQKHGIRKTQRLQLSQDQQDNLDTVQKLQQPQVPGNVELQKAEQPQEHPFNVKEQDDLRNEKLLQQMPNEEQEDVKLLQTQKQLHQEPQQAHREVGDQELQEKPQQELQEVQFQPEIQQEQQLQKGEDNCFKVVQKEHQYFVELPVQHEDQKEQEMHMLQGHVPIPDFTVVPVELPVKSPITVKSGNSFVYQQRFPKGCFDIPCMNIVSKAARKRKATNEVRQDTYKASRSFASQKLYLQGYAIHPIFATVRDDHFQSMDDCHLDKKKFERSDNHHIKSKDQKGFSDNLLIAKDFDGLEHRDVIEISKELDICSEKYSKFTNLRSNEYLLPKRVQALKTDACYQRSFKATETKQKGLDKLNTKSENLKELKAKIETQKQLQELRELKGLKAIPSNPKSTEILKSESSDSQTNKELECQEGRHSKLPEIKTSEDQQCTHSDRELKASTADENEKCTSWGKALVKCLKEMQARTSRHQILHEFGHSGSCTMADCRPSCRLFRRLRHHVVSTQHKCTLFHLYSSLLQEHVSVCCSPTCGLRACPAIRANRRVQVAVTSNTDADSYVPKTQIEMANKISVTAVM